MTFAYDLHVQFESATEDAVTGQVSVTVHEACTCRKLILRPFGVGDGAENWQAFDGQDQNLADWVEWRPNETYRYPFSISVGGVPSDQFALATEVHLIGELDLDPVQVWPVAWTGEQLQHAEPKAQPLLAPMQLLPSTPPSDRCSLVGEVTLELDRSNPEYAFGEDITGTVTFIPAQDLVDFLLGLDWQWRSHGLMERRSGGHHPVAIARQLSWEAGKEYTASFQFSVPSGPRTSHAYSEKLDWYVWPVLIPLDGSPPEQLLQAESQIHLQPRAQGGPRWVITSGTPQTQSHKHFLTFAASLVAAIVLALLHEPLWEVARRGELGLVILLILILAILAGLSKSAYPIILTGLAELLLGPVRVKFPNGEQVKATVSFCPHRTVRLRRLTLGLKIEEVRYVQQGTSTRKKRKLLFSTKAHNRLDDVVKADEDWRGHVAIAIHPTFPASSHVLSRDKNTTVVIDWTAAITLSVRGWFSWRRRFQLSVYGAGSR